MGLSADSFKPQLETMQNRIHNNQWGSLLKSKEMFIKLQNFYEHQKNLLHNYEKNVMQLNSDTKLLNSWIDILQDIIDIL